MQAVNLVYSVLVLVPGALSLHSNPARKQSRMEKDTVVMVRTCNPGPGMLTRMAEFERDLQSKAPYVQFVVSMDQTNFNHTDDLRRALGPNTLMHGYTWPDVIAAYPVLSSVEDASAWNFHVETISVAMQYVKKHAPVTHDAPVWVLEDDVFVCGSISDFINSYRLDRSDLLTASYTPFVDSWAMSTEFDIRFPPFSRVKSYEHVQRFSARFLDFLERESHDEEVTAMSETFVPTECWKSTTEEFTCGMFEADHIGDYKWDSELDAADVTSTCEEADAPTINHGAKFYRK